MDNRANIIIPRLLLAKNYRVYRHLILQFMILLISLEAFFDAPDRINFSAERIASWAGFFLLLNIMMYTNIYVLVPRLLLKAKIFLYLIFLLLLIFVSTSAVMGVVKLFFEETVTNIETNRIIIFISTASSILVMALILIATSALLLFKHWTDYNLRRSQLESATLQSELNFLKSQINPHFLFNMLNNANIMANEDPDISSRILVKLENMLRYQINDSARNSVYLSADIHFLTGFLDLEKTRRDYFDYTLLKEGNINIIQIPPLLFIPFVENAVKHNLDNKKASYVHISFKVQNDCLTFVCENSKPENPIVRKEGGLGLVNIKRRLDLLYSDNYVLEINETEITYTVNLQLNL